jgi:spoIIIJ-associated protein
LKEFGSEEETEYIEYAGDVVKDIVRLIGIDVEVEIGEEPVTYADENDSDITVLNINGEGTEILIGRKGQVLEALQHLVRVIVSNNYKTKKQIVLDVNGYRQRRYEDLKILALNIAEQVKSTNRSFKMEPMNAFERRIIHLTLIDDPEVETESVGEGESRKVVVVPK